MSRYFNSDGFDELDSDELYHFGIRGQKWGLRRFQNEDGTLTSEGKMRYGKGDSSVTRKVKRDWNDMSDRDFKAKYRTSRKEYLKRVRKYGDPYMNSPMAKMGKKLNAMRNKRPYNDRAAQKELDDIAASKGKAFKINKNLAVKALAGLAITAAGSYAVYKIANGKSGQVTTDSLQKNFSSAFDSPKRTPDRVTSDSLQKNFSSAFDAPRAPTSRPDRVTPDSLQKNFSNAFNQKESKRTINVGVGSEDINDTLKRNADRYNEAAAKVNERIKKMNANKAARGKSGEKSFRNDVNDIMDRVDKIYKDRDAAVKKETDRIRKEADAAERAESERKAKERADVLEYNKRQREIEKEEHDRYLSELRKHGFKDEDDYERYRRRD